MKTFLSALVLGALTTAVPAVAQEMTCEQYLQTEASVGKVEGGGNEATNAMDKKIHDYCAANPKVALGEATQKAMEK